MPRAFLLSLLLLGGCASLSDKDQAFLDSGKPESAAADTGRCKPWFISPDKDFAGVAPKRSCWHRLWEVPAALVAVPVALAIISAPVWGPILLLK